MRFVWDQDAWSDYLYWQTQDRRTLPRINELLRDIARGSDLGAPHEGIGKPEALRHQNLTGWWSRRITDEHRLVYRVHGSDVEIASCRYHYA